MSYPVFALKLIKLTGRAFVVYLIVLAFVFFLIDQDKIHNHAIVASLSRLDTSFDYIVLGMKQKTKFERRFLLSHQHYYQKVIDLLPPMADAYGMLGFFHYHLGAYDKARAAYKKASELNPHFLTYYYNLGLLYFKKGDYSQAAGSFIKAIETHLANCLVFVMSSKLYASFFVSLNEEKDVLESEIEMKLRENFRQCYLMLILSYYRLQNYPQMIQQASEAISLDLQPQDDFYFYIGLASHQLKDYERSIFFLKESIKRNPDLSDAFYYLALSMKALGKEELATKSMQKAIYLYNTKGSILGQEDQLEVEIY